MKSPNIESQPISDSERVAPTEDKDKIIKAEISQQGELSVDVATSFLDAAGGQFVIIALSFLIVFTQSVLCASDWFLAYWSQLSSADQINGFYLGVYSMLIGLCIICAVLRSDLFFKSVLLAASNLHSRMFTGVLYSPLSFFESQPSGRVLNRFAKDQGVIDDLLATTSFDTVQSGLFCVGALAIVGIANPLILLILIPIIPMFLYLRSIFTNVSRELKRLESTTRSPIYAQFSSTISGLSTVRSFNVSNSLINKYYTVSDDNYRTFSLFHAITRWFGMRLDFLTLLVVSSTVLIYAITKGSISPSLIGLSITYVLQLTSLFQWVVRQSAELENQFTSVERVVEYGKLTPEGIRYSDVKPPQCWPERGEINFEHVEMRYRPNLPLALADVNIKIDPSDKVGVCGRTGAGKSSLLSVLYRLNPACSGRIIIDGIDISTLGLYDLRSRLSIIPQEPVIFSGTLRYNCFLFIGLIIVFLVDPFNLYSDDKIWSALDAVNLKDKVLALPDRLLFTLAEFGSNLRFVHFNNYF